MAQISWDLACQSRPDDGESAAPRHDKQTTEGTKGNGLETKGQAGLFESRIARRKKAAIRAESRGAQ